jgi:hypothetical protein
VLVDRSVFGETRLGQTPWWWAAVCIGVPVCVSAVQVEAFGGFGGRDGQGNERGEMITRRKSGP